MIISSVLPFPPVPWWQKAVNCRRLVFDLAERYQKMSYRNRYYLSGPQGRQMLSIPLKGGRNQKVSMKEVGIAYDRNWQDHHWKTIKTLYQRSPFFEFFAPDIQQLFREQPEKLQEWNRKSITLIDRLLDLKLNFTETGVYQKHYPEAIIDLRQMKPDSPEKTVSYHQVFESHVGFQPNCSVLDFLFCEGPYAKAILSKA